MQSWVERPVLNLQNLLGSVESLPVVRDLRSPDARGEQLTLFPEAKP